MDKVVIQNSTCLGKRDFSLELTTRSFTCRVRVSTDSMWLTDVTVASLNHQCVLPTQLEFIGFASWTSTFNWIIRGLMNTFRLFNAVPFPEFHFRWVRCDPVRSFLWKLCSASEKDQCDVRLRAWILHVLWGRTDLATKENTPSFILLWDFFIQKKTVTFRSV